MYNVTIKPKEEIKVAKKPYYEQQQQKDIQLLRSLLKELPPFLREFFISLGNSRSTKTRLAYAYDLRIFFSYLAENHEAFKDRSILDFVLTDLVNIESEDIDLFLEYISFYEGFNINLDYENKENGKLRKLSAIRTMFRFFYSKKKISSNPAALVESPKIHEKPIVRLDVNEMCDLLDEVESGNNLTEKQKEYHKYTGKRDLAIVSLLVGTGMRVSECVGIDKSDINFDTNGVKIRRKGGNEVILYFGEEVREALIDYLEQRSLDSVDTEKALFISLQRKRINVRTVQNLVKKYSQTSVKLKNISPHKLRSTYGTNLYQETGDIYLVANTLGHADVNTTRKHYAYIEEEARRAATRKIKLRRE